MDTLGSGGGPASASWLETAWASSEFFAHVEVQVQALRVTRLRQQRPRQREVTVGNAQAGVEPDGARRHQLGCRIAAGGVGVADQPPQVERGPHGAPHAGVAHRLRALRLQSEGEVVEDARGARDRAQARVGRGLRGHQRRRGRQQRAGPLAQQAQRVLLALVAAEDRLVQVGRGAGIVAEAHQTHASRAGRTSPRGTDRCRRSRDRPHAR